MTEQGSMSREEAFRTLGLSEGAGDEEIRDAYEKACFDVRQKALMNLGVPRLMKKRFEVLHRANEAFKALGGEAEDLWQDPHGFKALIPLQEADRILGKPPPWSSWVRRYEKGLGEKKLRIANTFSAAPLSEGILELMDLQRAFHSFFYKAFSPIIKDDPRAYPHAAALFDPKVKAGQSAYSATLIQDLEKLEAGPFGNEPLNEAHRELEALLSEGKGDDEGVGRILTEAHRIHQLVLLDEKEEKKERDKP